MTDVKPMDRTGQLVLALLQLTELARDLPSTRCMRAEWSNTADEWQIGCFAFDLEGGEEADIDAARSWANLLDGTFHLAEPVTREYGTFTKTSRRLNVHGTIAGVPVVMGFSVDEHESRVQVAEPVAA